MSKTAQEALARVLNQGGFVRGAADRQGEFNDVYWEQSAAAILTALPDDVVLVSREELAAALRRAWPKATFTRANELSAATIVAAVREGQR